MGDFRQLTVWRRAHAIALAVYRATNTFPSTEKFGLVVQMRRAAVSIPANIAESSGRFGVRDQAHLLQTAKGSAKELECELLLASDLGFLKNADSTRIIADLDQVQRMLAAMIRMARSSPASSPADSPVSLRSPVSRLRSPQ